MKLDSIKAHKEAKDSIKELLQKEIYGFLPNKPEHFSFDICDADNQFAAGKAKLLKIKATLYNNDESFSFPIRAVIPNKYGKIPAFIYIDSEKEIPNKFLPCEEIADLGFAVFSFYYEDFTPATPKFNDKLSSFLGINRRYASASGKLILWAFAAMRVMDCLQTLDFIDKKHISVIGHSRLATSALLAAGFDERFEYAISNCASAFRRNESYIAANEYPHWFCPAFSRNGKEDFRQESLLALLPPRKLMIGNAQNHFSADLENEFSKVRMLSEIYRLYGLDTLIDDNEFPRSPTILDRKSICYHIRDGCEYLCRDDWHVYISHIRKNMENNDDL